jgi:hypothetical protein
MLVYQSLRAKPTRMGNPRRVYIVSRTEDDGGINLILHRVAVTLASHEGREAIRAYIDAGAIELAPGEIEITGREYQAWARIARRTCSIVT